MSDLHDWINGLKGDDLFNAAARAAREALIIDFKNKGYDLDTAAAILDAAASTIPQDNKPDQIDPEAVREALLEMLRAAQAGDADAKTILLFVYDSRDQPVPHGDLRMTAMMLALAASLMIVSQGARGMLDRLTYHPGDGFEIGSDHPHQQTTIRFGDALRIEMQHRPPPGPDTPPGSEPQAN